jgi:hypothetical protein
MHGITSLETLLVTEHGGDTLFQAQRAFQHRVGVLTAVRGCAGGHGCDADVDVDVDAKC